MALIEAMPIFAELTRDEKRMLADTATMRDYRKGDVIVYRRRTLASLMIVRAGVIVMRHEIENSDGWRRATSSARRGCSQAWARPTRWRP